MKMCWGKEGIWKKEKLEMILGDERNQNMTLKW